MGTPAQERGVRALAERIAEGLELIYGQEMGFYLVTSPLGNTDETISDYIGNCSRETGIAWMEETVKRLKAKQDIPASEGNA